MKRTTKEQRRRENKVLKALTQIAAIIALSLAGLLLFMLFIWYRAQAQPPRTDEELAAQIERERGKPLSIEIPKPETEGSITIYTPDGGTYGYFGEIEILNDGTDGHQIQIECGGWLVGEYQHGEPAYTEESEGSYEKQKNQ